MTFLLGGLNAGGISAEDDSKKPVEAWESWHEPRFDDSRLASPAGARPGCERVPRVELCFRAAPQSTPRMIPLVGTPVPAVTRTFSTFGT
jgi:hypothetical protein